MFYNQVAYINRQQRHRLTQQQRNNKRKRATPSQLGFLRQKFQENPRPNQLMREVIGKEIDMTPRSVQIWFQNNRAKLRVQRKKLASLHSLPLITSSCGRNLSRVHIDMLAIKERASDFRSPTWAYGSRDHILSGEDFSLGLNDSSVGEFDASRVDSTSQNDPIQNWFPMDDICRSETTAASTPESQISQPYTPFDPSILDFDLQDSSTEDAEKINITDNMPLYSSFPIWGLKIRRWTYNSDEMVGKIYLDLLSKTANVVIESISQDSCLQSRPSHFEMEFAVAAISKISSHHVRITLGSSPTFFSIVNNMKQPCELSDDFTQGEAFNTDKFDFFGQFDSLGDIYS